MFDDLTLMVLCAYVVRNYPAARSEPVHWPVLCCLLSRVQQCFLHLKRPSTLKITIADPCAGHCLLGCTSASTVHQQTTHRKYPSCKRAWLHVPALRRLLHTEGRVVGTIFPSIARSIASGLKAGNIKRTVLKSFSCPSTEK